MKKYNKTDDKSTELNRFEKRAKDLLNNDLYKKMSLGADSVPYFLRTPYDYYEENLRKLIHSHWNILELGSGNGIHTKKLIESNANITASDISQNSLKVLKKNYNKINSKLKTVKADIEKLPFDNESFNLVASAGSLSYGDSFKVDNEIKRVLKPGGIFICVDSLNNNPIYRFNRYVQYLKGDRSKITIKNMPSTERINNLRKLYSSLEVRYFGSISYFIPLISVIFGEKKSKNISDYFDKIFKIKKSAFKFVLIARV
tara:strand:- start:134 stop:907 length:774 start_codon:yes stop_codon:yes gene_type:complete